MPISQLACSGHSADALRLRLPEGTAFAGWWFRIDSRYFFWLGINNTEERRIQDWALSQAIFGDNKNTKRKQRTFTVTEIYSLASCWWCCERRSVWFSGSGSFGFVRKLIWSCIQSFGHWIWGVLDYGCQRSLLNLLQTAIQWRTVCQLLSGWATESGARPRHMKLK